MAEYESDAGERAVDALMAAITDEPLPTGAETDGPLMAEHRAALADVAVLREQLGIIGAALAEPGGAERPAPAPAPAPVPAPRERTGRPPGRPGRRSRRPAARAVAFGTLVAAAVAGAVVGMGWLAASGGAGISADSKASGGKADDSSSRSEPGYVACARLIVEGKVAEVEPVPGADQDRIDLAVDRYYKPAAGKDRITFVMDHDVDPRLHQGDHVLIGIPRDSVVPDIWTTGEKDIARERAWIRKALPESRNLTCE
ncbi:hypothetical protein [Streptomyces avermitilis]|uniref:hypothetical protein n=1 Tax=Streptomyces avermitilis TaxID=33903 RepID=UPI0033AD7FE8